MLNTRGHASKAINYNCQCVFEGSTELGVIIYGVLYRAIKNSPNGVNCFQCPGRAAHPFRARGKPLPARPRRGGGFGGRRSMRETRFGAAKPARPRLLPAGGGKTLFSASVATDRDGPRRGCSPRGRNTAPHAPRSVIDFTGDGEGEKELRRVMDVRKGE